jgi:hypothetical protein
MNGAGMSHCCLIFYRIRRDDDPVDSKMIRPNEFIFIFPEE